MGEELEFSFIDECEVRDPEMPEAFFLCDEVTLETEYECPYCHYQWSGQARVTKGTKIIDGEEE